VLRRPPHYEAARDIWKAAEYKRAEALVPAHGVTTLYYVVARARGASFARLAVGDLLAACGVAPVNDAVIRRALGLPWKDFEDAVCAASAEAAGCDLLVTRDPKGFPDSPVPVVDPLTAVSLLKGAGGPGDVAEPAARYSRARRPRRRRQVGKRVVSA
jgi:predicted nucleic acid-binding protein